MQALVIDDSTPVRHILAQMLRELDYQVTEATNGRDGLSRLRSGIPPDVATVNWNMPEMDGLEFVRAVRADPRLCQLPILMISGESDPGRVATALAAGASAYIVKPCTRRTLSEQLKRLGLAGPTSAQGARPADAEHHGQCRLPIRVLIVDDAAAVRRIVSSVLEDDPEIEVAGTAADGYGALEKLEALHPDVVLLDVEMPKLNGLETLKRLRQVDRRLPVIMFSSLTERGAAVTTDALLLGADDYVPKPGGTQMADMAAGKAAIREQLIPKIKQLSLRRRQAGSSLRSARDAPPARDRNGPSRGKIDVVVIAASTGGPCALAQMVPACAVGSPVPILIVQHMPPVFTRNLADRLAAGGRLDVREGADGEPLCPGQVRIAPGGFHMTVTGRRDQAQVKLNLDAPVNGCRPSADILFQSVAAVYGAATLAVVLTGMGNDGLLGCKRLRQAGAAILVQDESTSVVWGMPGQVVRAGLADDILPLDRIGPEIARRVRIRS